MNNLPNVPHIDFLFTFVMDQAASQPISNRIKIYRSMAELVGVENPEATELNHMANELEATEKKCRQFVFNFSNK
jgi:hypothetical protein